MGKRTFFEKAKSHLGRIKEDMESNTVNLEQIIATAIETGEVIEIKYHGGSQPGCVRKIYPVSINGDNVKARCLATNRVKTFKLSRMEPKRGLISTNSYVPGQKTPEPVSLKEALGPHERFLCDSGWVLSVEKGEAGIYRTFKNGKLRKIPDVFILYQEFTLDYVDFDDVGNIIEHTKPSTRPWYVRSNATNQASTFKKLSKATEKFIHHSKVAAEKLMLNSR